jgi:hypothetical protein
MDTFCIISNTTETCQDYCGEHCGEMLTIMFLFICLMCCFMCKMISNRSRYEMLFDEEEGEEEHLRRSVQTHQPPKYHEI